MASPVELGQVLRQEDAVLADDFSIEADLAAAPVLALDVDHVPVDLRTVAIVRILIGLAGREVERAGDFLIEEDVAHRLEDQRMHAEGELTDVARTLVAIEDLVDLFGFVARFGLDDFSFGKLQPDAVERDSLIDRRGVVGDHAFDGIRTGEVKTSPSGTL